MSVRVRYAPSPTGLQHVGGLRTALFNYLFARAQGGAFLLRLEDTDQTRCNPSYVQNLYDTFAWLGFGWDEGPDRGGPAGPYVQSERLAQYTAAVQRLLAEGKAYYCFCTAARLDALRKEREAARSPESGYDRACRALDPGEAAKRAKTEPYVIRLAIPLDQATRVTDQVLGEVVWKNSDINSDPVLLKSDGFPTYHLANVVDDHLMEITHVLRAQEWLASTPLHLILYRAFGWQPPAFCHLPMVMGADGKKLSKRHGATSVDEFRKNGVLPQALINYVAHLGASYEEGVEIYRLDELEKLFCLDKLNAAPAIFDYKKLEWFNARYIINADDRALAAAALPFARAAGVLREGDREAEARFTAAMPLVKERSNYLGEIGEKLRYLFAEPELPAAVEFTPKKSSLEDAARCLQIARGLVESLSCLDDEAAEALVKERAAAASLPLGSLLMPLRVAITGARVSPPLFGSIRLLGAEKALARVDRSLALLQRAIEGRAEA